MEQFKGRNPIGSFVDDTPIHSVTATSGVDVKEPEVRVSHEDQVSCVRKKTLPALIVVGPQPVELLPPATDEVGGLGGCGDT